MAASRPMMASNDIPCRTLLISRRQSRLAYCARLLVWRITLIIISPHGALCYAKLEFNIMHRILSRIMACRNRNCRNSACRNNACRNSACRNSACRNRNLYPLASCARLSCIHSFRVHVKLFYRIVSYHICLSRSH